MTETQKIHRILVIDDDPGMIRLMGALLKSKGYQVILADEAPKGLECAMKQKPELIILDVMMPIINGFNICRLLKSQQTHKHIPIMLLTSRVTEEDHRIGMEVGADAYMIKPVNTEEFLAKVKELLKI
jgi:DNA-binding response OmpR family regulator